MAALKFIEHSSSYSDTQNGTLAVSCNGVPCLNIEKRGMYYWEPLTSLSSVNWKLYRGMINSSLEKYVENANKKYKEIIIKERENLEQTKTLFYKLYQNLSIPEKKTFLKENKNTWLAKETCPVCLKKSIKKNKCVHHDCCGMCDECFADKLDEEHKCKACKKTQNIQCPICFDEKPLEEMCKSNKCVHYVCWSCFGKAFHSGNPLYKCPCCRDQFTIRNDQYGYDSDLTDYDTDYEEQQENFDEISNLDQIQLEEAINSIIDESRQIGLTV
jgi:hypothetical protein